jgi:hypothetical protein
VRTTIGALIVRRTSEADWGEGSGAGLLDDEPMSARQRGQLDRHWAMDRDGLDDPPEKLFGGRNFNPRQSDLSTLTTYPQILTNHTPGQTITSPKRASGSLRNTTEDTGKKDYTPTPTRTRIDSLGGSYSTLEL